MDGIRIPWSQDVKNQFSQACPPFNKSGPGSHVRLSSADWKTNSLLLFPPSRNASPSDATSSLTWVPSACHGKWLQASSKLIHGIPKRRLEVLLGGRARVWHVWATKFNTVPHSQTHGSLWRRKEVETLVITTSFNFSLKKMYQCNFFFN
jgi:hypothetical protein